MNGVCGCRGMLSTTKKRFSEAPMQFNDQTGFAALELMLAALQIITVNDSI